MYKYRFCAGYRFFWRRESIRFDAKESAATEIILRSDGKSTQQFLAQFKNHYFGIGALRGLLSESRRWMDTSRLTGDQVLAEVARLILSGELGVARRARSATGGASSTQRSGDAPPIPAGAPLGHATKAEEPEPATFPPVLNALIQAAALSAAAARGAAFCPH